MCMFKKIMKLFDFFPGYEEVTEQWSLFEKVIMNVMVPVCLMALSIGLAIVLSIVYDWFLGI